MLNICHKKFESIMASRVGSDKYVHLVQFMTELELYYKLSVIREESQINVDESIKYYEGELDRCGGKDQKIEHCLSVLKEYKAQGKTIINVSEHPVYDRLIN